MPAVPRDVGAIAGRTSARGSTSTGAGGPGAREAGGCWVRKKNRKVVADKEKNLEEEYREIMEVRREMKIMASPMADIVP